MYFPYLYGKQKELIAIRRLAAALHGEGMVVPVVEPVREDAGTLLLTLRACEKASLPSFVIVNPALLQFAGAGAGSRYKWGRDLFTKLGKYKAARPTLLVSTGTTIADIKKFKSDYATGPVGFVIRTPDLPVTAIATEIGALPAESRVFLHGAMPSPAALTALHKKRCVWVEARFPEQARNADYHGFSMFTDVHLTHALSGYAGFSDFTVLPATAKDGGGPAGAVAIHLTYLNTAASARGEVWVQHFVSDRSDVADTDTPGKFLEALAKFDAALKRKHTSFGMTPAADAYKASYDTSSPPTLAANKQWEIEHHLDLMSGILSKRYKY